MAVAWQCCCQVARPRGCAVTRWLAINPELAYANSSPRRWTYGWPDSEQGCQEETSTQDKHRKTQSTHGSEMFKGPHSLSTSMKTTVIWSWRIRTVDVLDVWTPHPPFSLWLPSSLGHISPVTAGQEDEVDMAPSPSVRRLP